MPQVFPARSITSNRLGPTQQFQRHEYQDITNVLGMLKIVGKSLKSNREQSRSISHRYLLITNYKEKINGLTVEKSGEHHLKPSEHLQ